MMVGVIAHSLVILLKLVDSDRSHDQQRHSHFPYLAPWHYFMHDKGLWLCYLKCYDVSIDCECAVQVPYAFFLERQSSQKTRNQ